MIAHGHFVNKLKNQKFKKKLLIVWVVCKNELINEAAAAGLITVFAPRRAT
jgi:hypothetical protein